ncbi:HNH endonuclease [Shewanella sp.]|uniref:HNH endonuclease n=1 Tax=Shewanella sp. TaxID=50422 RepID=UPI003D13322D
MAFYWVNIGTTYKEVLEHKFLWAPDEARGKNGKLKNVAGWLYMPHVQKGDIIFCNRDQNIIYVAVAKSDSYNAARPETRAYKEWSTDGHKVDVELHILPTPIEFKEVSDHLFENFNDDCDPKLITVNNTVSQNYLVSLPEGAGSYLLALVGQVADKISECQDDVRSEGRPVSETKRKVLADARIGQGKYRKELLALWDNKCPLTGVDVKELLIASHILPWSQSDNKQRLDPYNGFPFSPNIDKLFDKGYVSFGDDGAIMVKKAVSTKTLQQLGLNRESKLKGLKPAHKAYLQKHREIFKF